MKIHILFNNYSNNPDLLPDWGFSALIKIEKENILFDTGSNGPILIENIKRLGLKTNNIKKVVISHNHWDHIGGLLDIARLNKGLRVYTPDIDKELTEKLSKLDAKIFVVRNETRISNSIYTTSVFKNSINELALVCKSSKGKVILTGCSHPGILKILKAISGPKYLLLGGLHLFRQSIDKINEISRGLEELGIKFIAPSHCTGEEVVSYFKDYFGKRLLYGGLGAIFKF